MFCSSCGAKCAAESNFCRQCGQKLDQPSTPKISEEAFDRALPEHEQVTALLERAYRQRKSGDLPGAIALCKEVLEIRPDSTTAHGLLGQLYEQKGDHQNAVAQYERVLQLNPGSIADRVKLDDLREGGPKLAGANNGTSRVVVVDSNGASIRGLAAWGVALAAVLILSGVVLAMAFNRHEPVREGQVTVRPPKSNADLEPPASNNTAQASQSVPHSQGVNNAASSSGQAAFGPNPVYGFGSPVIQYDPRPIQYIQVPGGGPQRPQAAPAGGAAPSRTVKSTVASESDQGSVPVHLSAAEGTVSGDGSNLTIKVTPKSPDGGVKPAPPGGGGPPVLKMKERPGPADQSSAYAPTAESTGLISMCEEKLNKQDFAGASIAFRKALQGANDQAGYIYQKLGECYQGLHDNKNAIANYEKGRDEYKKLISAGRLVERANEGIRICDNGIKICNSE